MAIRLLQPFALAAGIALALNAGAADAPRSSIDPAKLDSKAGACTDFFGYVNNIAIKNDPIPADQTSWGTFNKLRERSLATQHDILDAMALDKAVAGTIQQKIGDFYASGMDQSEIEKAGYTPIKDDLKRVDGLRNPDDIAELVRDYAARGDALLFDFERGADFKNSTMTIGFANQGGLGLPDRDYYLKTDAESKKLLAAYQAHIANLLILVGVKKDDASKQAQAVVDLETKLANASLSRVALRDPTNQYHLVSMTEGDKATPHFSWLKYFAAQGVSGQTGFSLAQPEFFATMDKLIAEAPIAQWQAYFRFHIVASAAPTLSKAFVEERFAFVGKTLQGQKENKPRWKRVLGATNSEMGMALGELYVAKTFPPEAKQRAQDMVNDLHDALKTRIENLDWMSAETKKQALEKWATFMPKIGYPDAWRDWSGLSISREGYVANIRAADKFNHAWEMAKIGKPVDRREWGMTPQTVNAYYNPLLNEIVFPAAILQPPFFDPKADDALNYGAIGAVIGHEMTHGFDDEGSQFDAKGNQHDWWTAADKKDFESRTAKLVKQFDDYIAIGDLHVNGKLTLGENIADLGGINVAFDALHAALKKRPQAAIDGLTPEQRFFIAFGNVWGGQYRDETLKLLVNTDPHSPLRFRAIAAPSNMPAFAQSFQCKPGDAMVRSADTQVKIW
jgi:putative endopeptidase